MASNERQFKSEIVERAREQGGQVVVVSGSYLAGIPDLYIKMPEMPGVWLELKYDVRTQRNKYRNKLTPLQRIFIRNMRHVNGEAAWLLCVKQLNTWTLYGSTDPDVDQVDERHFLTGRSRGSKWNVLSILEGLGVPYNEQ